MDQLINRNVKEIEISGIRKFFNMVADTKDMISLTIGQPDFPTPNHVKEAAKKQLMRILHLILIMPVPFNYVRQLQIFIKKNMVFHIAQKQK